jgi:S-DNA-T family DNA segregation ATPase FtsK/SpoIIIE
MPASTARSLPRGVASRGRSSRFATLLPNSAEEFFRRRLTELTGLAHIAVAVALIAALATFYAGDPSWNVSLPPAWVRHTRNLLGLPGAYFADMFIQTLGLASYLLPLAIAVWGARLLRHRRTVPLWRRLIILFPSLLVASGTLAVLKPFPSWPLAVSLGGSVGDAILKGSARGIDGLIGGGGVWVAWPLITLLTLVMLSVTFGINFAGWRAAFGAVAGAGAWSGRFVSGIGFPAINLRRARSDDDDDEAAEPARTRVALRREPEIGGGKIAIPNTISAKEPRKPARIMAGAAKKAEVPDPRQSSLNLPEPTDYMLPPHDLLQPAPPEARSPELNEEFLQRNAEMLSGVLSDFGVKGDIVNIRPGPVVTLYELEPAPGTKSSRVIGLADDLARSMSALAVRVAVVPGRNVIGIELPNQKRETVYMREILDIDSYQTNAVKLPLILGKDIGGLPVIADLARMPHLLVAGTTGSGKSVAINTMILSLLYRLPPERCRFIMVDPKMLELSVYEGIPHLLAPVVTDPKKAVVALKWTVREMEDRYRAMSKLGVRNVDGFNQRLREARENGEMLTRKVQTGFDADTGKPVFEDQAFDLKELPYIVVIVDEFADLMLVAGKEIEGAIQRLAQMARAAGIHLIMATQRPSVDVITGTIKANFPTRISFQVTSKIDSRTILGESGAEQLLGQGDMLYMAAGGRVTRVHGPFVRDQEVEKIVAYLKTQGEPDYVDEVTEDDDFPDDMALALGEEGGGSGDDLYDQAVALVAREGKASTSFVQRHLQIGYNKAARLIERMEKEGVVSTANHVGKREVLVGNHSGD